MQGLSSKHSYLYTNTSTKNIRPTFVKITIRTDAQTIISVLVLFSTVTALRAQVTFRTEYIGRSAYKDIDNKLNGGRGSATVYSGSAQLPFSFSPTDDAALKHGVSLCTALTPPS